ncbi:MAG: hypothetical protein ABW007_26070 [Chitinophagaceae bacterium]
MQFLFALLLVLTGGQQYDNRPNALTIPLSIQLSVIHGGKTAQLRWNVSARQLYSSFVVERKINDRFYVIDSCTGSGHTVYEYADRHPSPGSNIYRVRCIVSGQTAICSNERAIIFSAGERLIISGSPGSKNLVVFHAMASKNEKITIVNTKDEIIHSSLIRPERTFTTVSIPNVPAGLYFLNLIRPGGSLSQAIVID